MHRRSLLGAVGAATSSVLAGCVFGRSVEAGTLVISNDHDQRHLVTVTVRKISEDDGDIPPRPHDAPAPTGTPLWERKYSFEVPADGAVRESDLLTEPGAYYVEVSLDSGGTASTWLGLYAAGESGNQIAEAHILVSIADTGRVTVSTPVDD